MKASKTSKREKTLFLNEFINNLERKGAHILYMFNDEKRYLDHAYQFISKGIQHQDKILLVDEKSVFRNLSDLLVSNGYSEEEMNLIDFMPVDEFYLSAKGFNAEDSFKQLEEILQLNFEKGIRTRTWGQILPDDSSISEIRKYESHVDRLLQGSNTISVCAYNAFITPAFFQNELLKIHEYVMMDDVIEKSPFYHKKYTSFPASERERVQNLEKENNILIKKNEELLIGNARQKEREKYLELQKINAEKANHAKTVFLSQMSHDLRTPLNTIQGYSQILLMNKNSSELNQKISKIYNASEQLLNLIEEILDFTAINTGRVNIHKEEIQVKSFLEDCVGSILETNTSDIDIHFEGVPSELFIEADPVRLNQIMTNLLDNAMKYNRTNGTVHIYCDYEKDSEEVKINVKDSGIGIEHEDLDLIYEPFYRSKSTMNNWKGTGIGLAIVSQLTKRMNGKYGVTTEGGKGSTFWVSFKKLTKQSNEFMQNNEEQLIPLSQPLRVLYIEDNTDNIDVMRSMLRIIQTIDLQCVTSGKEGIKQVIELKPDIVLLDIALPDMNGFEALKHIKSNSVTKDIPVIAVSADAMESTIKKASEEGCYAYIKKPIHLDEIRNLLESTIKYIVYNRKKGHGH
ncbi:ATP-binding protein [Bacillus sp. AFS040349]|uniref:ATP-binding protein n=1 Tax=Bacillus sp. AFS040349 TaxID=2033502 RepID=UPI00159B8FA8|nr:ATP-binding protein [Bacillus sp. AFS040349]